jgi:transglutaminase-like putative cysteine protease
MPIVSIRHRTTYRYRNPVAFGEHRMMLRPRESYDQRLISADLHIGPGLASLRNVQDLFGNCVGIARFAGRSDILTFDSHVVLDHSPSPAFSDLAGEPEAHAGVLPIEYGADDLADLAQSIAQRYPDPDGVLAAWALSFLDTRGPTSAQALLTRMTRAIHADFAYGKRLEGPPQDPLETLRLKTGSCRDLAVLMIEAVRSLGLAARFVSGYVYSGRPARGRTIEDRIGGGHTHAWVRVYLPACGWVEFDPTNGIVGNTDLVRVAIAREARQALPLHGSWMGQATDFLDMEVSVEIDVEEAEAAMQAPVKRRAGSSGA